MYIFFSRCCSPLSLSLLLSIFLFSLSFTHSLLFTLYSPVFKAITFKSRHCSTCVLDKSPYLTFFCMGTGEFVRLPRGRSVRGQGYPLFVHIAGVWSERARSKVFFALPRSRQLGCVSFLGQNRLSGHWWPQKDGSYRSLTGEKAEFLFNQKANFFDRVQCVYMKK